MIGESTGHEHFDRAIQEIDAGIFSGDALWTAQGRRVFQAYLARWLKASVEAEETHESPDDYVDFKPALEENAARSRRGLRR